MICGRVSTAQRVTRSAPTYHTSLDEPSVEQTGLVVPVGELGEKDTEEDAVDDDTADPSAKALRASFWMAHPMISGPRTMPFPFPLVTRAFAEVSSIIQVVVCGVVERCERRVRGR